MKLKHLVACCILASVFALAGCNGSVKDAPKEQESSLWEKAEESSAEDSAQAAEAEDNTQVAEVDVPEDENGSAGAVEVESADSEVADADSTDTAANSEDNLEAYEIDYTDDIKADVDAVAASASTLQEELANIETVTDKYKEIFSEGYTQYEMNIAGGWYYKIWDTELNSLWSRFSEKADEQTKEKLLADQRNWIGMQDEVIEASVGTSEENGSMYPLIRSSLLEESTKNRSYIIANEIAKITGEEFAMPKAPGTNGTYVDNQGTGSVYSTMIFKANWENEDTVKLSIYRTGEIEGAFTDNGDGTASFESEDGSVKGIITFNGWDGATFEVTEDNGTAIISAGEKYEFPFVF